MQALVQLPARDFNIFTFCDIVDSVVNGSVSYHVVDDFTDDYLIRDIYNGITIIDPHFIKLDESQNPIIDSQKVSDHLRSQLPQISAERFEKIARILNNIVIADRYELSTLFEKYIYLIHALFEDKTFPLINNVPLLNDITKNSKGEDSFSLNELQLDKLLTKFNIFPYPPTRARVIARIRDRYNYYIKKGVVIDINKIKALPKILPVD